jgi:hypothetical protein
MITKGRRKLTSTILILLTLLLTTPTLFADGPGRKNVRGDRGRGRGRPAWFLKMPHFIFRNFRKYRNRYEYRKRAKNKKKNSLNARRRNRRSSHGRRNRWFGRWH